MSADSAPRSVPLRRNRDFMLLWSGQVVSTVGMRVSSLAYPLLVLYLTGSPLRAGLVASAQSAPFLLLYLPAGALVDRWDRKRVMLAADGSRALLLASVAAALAIGGLTFAQIILVVILDGSCFVFFQLAESASLPRIVTRDQLPTAWAQNQARELGAEMAGQPLGGALFAISHLLPFAADALSYVVSFVTLLFVRPISRPVRGNPNVSLATEIAEGLAWLWRQPLLRTLVGLTGAANLVLNPLPLVVIVRVRQLGAGPLQIGTLLAFSGAAAIAGALAAPWLQRRIPASILILASLWTWAAVTAVLVLMRTPLAVGITAAVASLTGPAFNVVLGAYRSALAPDHLQARTTSSARMITWGTIPLATLIAGALMQASGAAATLFVLGCTMTLIAVTATSSATVRQAPRLQDLHATGLE
jgi:hypothetical protein